MPYVVTQSCCADASCVVACPVNCIHPAPGEPGFAEAEMVHIDQDACVGCGACVTACPVGAIKADTRLSTGEQPFVALNAEYYEVFPHADRAPVAVVPPQRRLTRPGPFQVAVIGAGPAGLYTADELLKHPEVAGVDVYERLRTPYGLVRFGVAPDHTTTKQVSRLFATIERQPRFRYRLGVHVGRDVTLAELRQRYDAVVYAVGASADRRLDIPGEDLPGSVAATELVGWYNGHPDRAALEVPLDHERAVVIGNGNVALDVARILTADPETLVGTDLAAGPLGRLRTSAVREVVVLGRRGPAQSAFTVPELIGLSALADAGAIDVVIEADPDEPAGTDTRSRLLAGLARRTPSGDGQRRRIVLRFGHSPIELLGEHRVEGVRVVRNRLERAADGSVRAVPTDETSVIDAGLVVRSIGHRGLPVPDLPFDEATGTVPNDAGRVEPGVYVVGWIKRGPVGFIGTNKTCAEETVSSLLDDLDAGLPAPPAPAAAEELDGHRGRDRRRATVGAGS
ncbi:4Fe-4S dicluster domain-containing protein [Nocardioides sp. GY 10113]|uniref:FAD-dependent oxidoreductase n=1 Tax=Nocardioides sp. GY 10113 TaxID=2569761 RepID=UPI0010A8828B|nr:FAD-dependent oxidoreductase [Nocardioides sp. GY 10113]TIC89042.1 4Fe-4S dicluster domain-containing protein [Nocardioides sp. GY 10113]